MRIWPALLLAPLLALTEQAVVYALATPTCHTQRQAWLHILPVAFAIVTLVFTLMAWVDASRQRAITAGAAHLDVDAPEVRRYFLARIAVWCGALSTLVIVAVWIPQWVLSPCAA
jgi:hypothetical protein